MESAKNDNNIKTYFTYYAIIPSNKQVVSTSCESVTSIVEVMAWTLNTVMILDFSY